jgi:hypothetical protein
MAILVSANTRGGGSQHLSLESTPDACPRCHRSIDVQPLWASFSTSHRVQAVFRCTASECDELFLGTYTPAGAGGGFRLMDTAPVSAQPEVFPESVSALSPSFVEIHEQAVAAEAQELDQLVGIGLRKALEFLMKDFLIEQHPKEADAIKTTLLGGCIEKWVTDPNIKECAKRAAWLGNDETHYTRKWGDRDIEDLKRLVRLTTNWVDNVLLTKRYMAEMPPPSR